MRNGKKGGRNSGEARRQKRDLKKTMESLLQMKVPKSEMKKTMGKLGIPEDGQDYCMAVCVSMLDAAVHGDVSAAIWIRDMVEKSPAQEIRWEYLELRKQQFELHESRHENETWSTGKLSASFLAALQPAEAIQELFRNPQPNRDISDFE